MSHESERARLLRGLDEALRVARWDAVRLHRVRSEVSRWSPAQQVDHALRVLVLNLRAVRLLLRGDDARIARGEGIRSEGEALLAEGAIPRGRAPAPEGTAPDAQPDAAALGERIAGLRARVEGLAGADPDAHPERTLPHPLLGPFDAARWLRFAAIHLDHHLALVRDIDGAER